MFVLGQFIALFIAIALPILIMRKKVRCAKQRRVWSILFIIFPIISFIAYLIYQYIYLMNITKTSV
ncbi:hypothetical protein GCM10011501_11620 [Thalassotalea profundi]|uniref:Cardiolipin synthase N-terminal domain-containing protein n=1 Tax=Thalassotalea profundi TaxID=2036687 RepID=A0ABQ3ILH8_9GAMM|nr:hypothetical protein GCM10011501_11620 [Thalassotalea profundi]